jgi:formamidopyrimidine-DNA glycosylase
MLVPATTTTLQVSKLGPDPLRPDDDCERFWSRVQGSKKPIGLLLMDQTAVAGALCCAVL